MADISELRILDSCKLIHNRHGGGIYRKSYVSLMPSVHFMAGADKKIISVRSHTCGTCVKGIGGICTEKAAGTLGFPVFGVFAHPVNFFRIIFFGVVCAGKDIIVVVGFVESAEYRQWKIESHRFLKVVSGIIVFNQKLTVKGTTLNPHERSVWACCKIGFDRRRPDTVVLVFKVASFINGAGCI